MDKQTGSPEERTRLQICLEEPAVTDVDEINKGIVYIKKEKEIKD